MNCEWAHFKHMNIWTAHHEHILIAYRLWRVIDMFGTLGIDLLTPFGITRVVGSLRGSLRWVNSSDGLAVLTPVVGRLYVAWTHFKHINIWTAHHEHISNILSAYRLWIDGGRGFFLWRVIDTFGTLGIDLLTPFGITRVFGSIRGLLRWVNSSDGLGVLTPVVGSLYVAWTHFKHINIWTAHHEHINCTSWTHIHYPPYLLRTVCGSSNVI